MIENQNYKFAIICALLDEAKPFLFFLKNKGTLKILKKTSKISLFIFSFSKPLFFLNKKIDKLYIYVSGVGKTNASHATSILINKYNVNFLINVGLVGLANKTFDLCIPIFVNKSIYHDVDLTDFNYRIGQLPNLPQIYKPLNYKTIFTKKDLDKNFSKYYEGNIATGDQFITEKSFLKILTSLNWIDAFDMELASIMQVCFIEKVKVLAIKFGSDYIGSKDNSKTFIESKTTYLNICPSLINLLFK